MHKLIEPYSPPRTIPRTEVLAALGHVALWLGAAYLIWRYASTVGEVMEVVDNLTR